MADFLLASAGDDIKLWDIREYSLVKPYNPHSGNVSSLHWIQDNSCLGSASTIGDKIAITYPNNPAYSFDIATEEEKSCIAFNSMSRYVMGGGADGLIHIWDLKTRKLKMTYKDHKARVTSIQFNWNDTMIASGSDSGEIILFSVVTGIGYSPLVVPKGQAVRQVQYSHFKKSLLSSASDDGSINLWDTSSKRLLHSFVSSHKAPAMGLAFSPLNEMLLMSVGLDKRIVCYDVLGKCAVKTMSAESPLTSIDLMPDGATLAVGTTRGKVLIYDLRQGATPVKVLPAHKSSVQCLKFQHGAKTYNKTEVGGKPKSSTSIKHVEQEMNINTVNNNPSLSHKDISNGVSAARSLPNLDNQPKESANAASHTNYTSCHNVSMEGRDYSPTRDEVFSPLAEHDKTGHRGQQSGLESTGPSPLTSSRPVSTGFTKEEEKLYGFDNLMNTFDDLDLKSKMAQDSDPQSMASSMTTSSSREFDGMDEPPVRDDTNHLSHFPDAEPYSEASISYGTKPAADRHKPVSEETSLTRANHNHNRTRSSELRQHSDNSKLTEGSKLSSAQSLHLQNTVTTPPEAAPSEGAVGGATGPALQPFHTQFIRNIVEDALDDFRDQIRQDILNLHTEVLKQFLVQQAEVERLVRHHSINEELLAEVERLKEENRRLKKRF